MRAGFRGTTGSNAKVSLIPLAKMWPCAHTLLQGSLGIVVFMEEHVCR